MELNYNDLHFSNTLAYKLFETMGKQADEHYEKYDRLTRLNCALTNRLKSGPISLDEFNAVMSWYNHSDLDAGEIMNLVFG